MFNLSWDKISKACRIGWYWFRKGFLAFPEALHRILLIAFQLFGSVAGVLAIILGLYELYFRAVGRPGPFIVPLFLKDYLPLHVGLFLALLGVGTGLYRSLRRMKDLQADIKQLKNAANDLRRYAKDNADIAMNIAGTLLKVKFSEKRKLCPTSSIDSLQAVACNLNNWENHVLGNDSLLTEVWLRAMRTYFLEEAYDIQHKELVTNGRNLPYILISALDAIISQRGNATVVYAAVTPVNPKDWYNWPHGYSDKKYYYEEEFLSLYHRTLREVIRANPLPILEHRRYVLSKESKEAKEPFGWKLDTTGDMKDHLSKTWIVPLSFPHELTLELGTCPLANHLSAYYGAIPWGNPVDFSYTPLFNSKWEPKDDETPNVSSAMKDLKAFPKDANVKELVLQTQAFYRRAIESLATPVANPDDCTVLREFNEHCNMAGAFLSAGSPNNSRGTTVLDWLRSCHRMDASLAEKQVYGRDVQNAIYAQQQIKLRRLRNCVLKWLDFEHHSEGSACVVRDIFAHDLQTAPELAFISQLKEDEFALFRKSQLSAEFHFFGLKSATSTPQPDRIDAVDWKFALTASMDYPFDAAKIQFHIPNAKDGFESYLQALYLIHGKRIPMVEP